MRKGLIWFMAIVASLLLTAIIHTPIIELFSLFQNNRLELSKVTCDSLVTSDIHDSCLRLDKYPQQMVQGDTFKLILLDPKGFNVTSGFTFTSTQPNIASIGANGQIKAITHGTTEIIIEHRSGYYEMFELTVLSPIVPEAKISLTCTLSNTRKTVTEGERFTISAKIAPAEFANKVSFTSSDPTIATINKDGLIVALLPGKVTIKAVVEDESASFVLEVLKKNEVINLSSLSLVSSSKTMEVNATQQLTVTKTPSNANEAIEFFSSDPSILTVSTSGKVSAKTVGTASITVRNVSGTISSTVTISVVNALDVEKLIQQVFKLTNQERVNAGLSALDYSQVLEKGAMIRAKEIIQQFSHTRPNGTKFYTVFNGTYSYRLIGENLAAGQTTAASVVSAWMNSETHRANILKEGFTQIGIGIAKDKNGRIYWVQIFADPK